MKKKRELTRIKNNGDASVQRLEDLMKLRKISYSSQ